MFIPGLRIVHGTPSEQGVPDYNTCLQNCGQPDRDTTAITVYQGLSPIHSFIANRALPKKTLYSIYPYDFIRRVIDAMDLLPLEERRMVNVRLYRAFISKSSGMIWLIDEWPEGPPVDECDIWHTDLFSAAISNPRVMTIMLVDKDNPYQNQRIYWDRGDPEDGSHRPFEPEIPQSIGQRIGPSLGRLAPLIPGAAGATVVGGSILIPKIIDGLQQFGQPKDKENFGNKKNWQDVLPSTHAQAPTDMLPAAQSAEDIQANAPATKVNPGDAQPDLQASAQTTASFLSDPDGAVQPGKRSLRSAIRKRSCRNPNYDLFSEPFVDSAPTYKLGVSSSPQGRPDPGVAKEESINLYNSQISITLRKDGKMTLPFKAEVKVKLGDSIQPFFDKFLDFLLPNKEIPVVNGVSFTFKPTGNDILFYFRSGDDAWDGKSQEHGCESGDWKNGVKTVRCQFHFSPSL